MGDFGVILLNIKAWCKVVILNTIEEEEQQKNPSTSETIEYTHIHTIYLLV